MDRCKSCGRAPVPGFPRCHRCAQDLAELLGEKEPELARLRERCRDLQVLLNDVCAGRASYEPPGPCSCNVCRYHAEKVAALELEAEPSRDREGAGS